MARSTYTVLQCDPCVAAGVPPPQARWTVRRNGVLPKRLKHLAVPLRPSNIQHIVLGRTWKHVTGGAIVRANLRTPALAEAAS